MKTIALSRSLTIGLVILFVGAFVVPTAASATTIIYVDDDNTTGPWDGTLEHPYEFIQDGIDSASSGDTVYVFNGTYYENVDIRKGISLIGEDRNNTVIDGGWNGSAVYASADSVNITGFTLQNGGGGLHAGIFDFYCTYSTFSGNNIRNNSIGIHQRYGSNGTISGNNITDNVAGIFCAVYSSNYTISGNTIANNESGISLRDPYNYTIINNSISGGISIWGDTLSHWNSHTIENNYANGKPIYYYKNDTSAVTVPSDAGQVILANCSNFTIENLEISDVRIPVQLAYSSHNNITGNTFIHDTSSGIEAWAGIELWWSSHNNITENIVKNNEDYGMCLRDSSDSNSILGNTIANHNDGIQVRNSSLHNIISENTITDNSWGLSLVFGSDNNIIYHNNFINNIGNAFDGCDNVWDDGYPSGGNYWSDFDEPDEGAYDINGDGLVDSPYDKMGGGNQDRYPFIDPWDGTPPGPPECGDVNLSGEVNSADIVYLINYLFRNGPEPRPAACVGDVNRDGIVSSADIVYLYGYLFVGGPAPGSDCCSGD